MNQNFFLWYYTLGLMATGVVVSNLFRYVFHRFHILTLLATLLSPWKKDVSFRRALGFHPLVFLQTLFENFISRFLGMLVRLAVIATGLLFLILSVPLGIGILGWYVLAPALLGLSVVAFFSNPLLAVILLALSLSGLIGAYMGYLSRLRAVPETTDIVVLRKERWFKMLLGRLGLEQKNLDSSVLESTAAFLSFLLTRGINREVYEKAVEKEREAEEERQQKNQIFSWSHLRRSSPLGRGWQYGFTSHLDRYVLDLSVFDPTEYAKLPLFGKDEAVQVTTLVLERPTQNSVLLVGDPGIGKKAIIHTLARRIRQNEFLGTALGDMRVLVFDVGRAVSDALNQGKDGQGALRDLLAEGTYAGNVILVIENIDTYLGSDASHRNLAPVLGEFLALPNFRLIATTTTGRYHTLAKTDEQLLKFFETIHLRETNEEETLAVLLAFARTIEHKKVIFSLPGLQSLIAQSSRYKWEVPMPERALDLAQEVLIYWQGNGEESIIGPKTVEAYITLKTGMPTGTIGSDEKDKLLNLEAFLHERIIGQDVAVRQVAESMRKARAGFGDAKRPLGSFIFLGPTGVGKTETVKALAESYFGSEDRMIRLDMSEFQTPEAVDRLIGSDVLGLSGQLTELVKEHPFSILLLDELEKAYPKALDLFLQILDEGFVTDGHGEKVNFRNTIIIATSNAGAPIIRDGLAQGLSFEDIRKQVMDFIVNQGIYRLEFLNRFDGVVFFEPLRESELLKVTELKLRSFGERLKKEKNITIEFAPGVAEKIVAKGYEPEFGARSINRYIEDTIEDAVVNQIIAGSVVAGGVLSVTAEDI